MNYQRCTNGNARGCRSYILNVTKGTLFDDLFAIIQRHNETNLLPTTSRLIYQKSRIICNLLRPLARSTAVFDVIKFLIYRNDVELRGELDSQLGHSIRCEIIRN